MKKWNMIRNFLLFIFSGFILIINIFGSDKNKTLFDALFSVQDVKISPENTLCEINGQTKTKDGRIINNPVTVKDFLDSYIKFLGSGAKKKFFSLNCNDAHEPPNCSLEYGQNSNEDNPGWSMILRLPQRYDS